VARTDRSYDFATCASRVQKSGVDANAAAYNDDFDNAIFNWIAGQCEAIVVAIGLI